MRFVLILLSTVALILPAARAQDDKLPEGAIMRLGDLRWRFAEHSAESKRYAWLPDSSGIVCCGRETIRLFDAKTGRVIRDWKGDRGDCFMSVAVSPDGKTLAATKLWGLVYLWDIGSGKKLKVLAPDGGIRKEHYVDHIAWSPDGKRLVTGRHAVQLWDVEKEKLVRVWWQSPTDIEVVGFRPDGKSVFALNKDHVLQWKVDSDSLDNELLIHDGSPRFIDRSGSTIAINSIVKKGITLWNATTGYELGKFDGVELRGSDGMVLAPDGKFLWTTSWKPGEAPVVVTLWDTRSRVRLRQFKIPQQMDGVPLISPDARMMAMLSARSQLSLVDLAIAARHHVALSQQARSETGVFSSDGATLLSITSDAELFLWQTATGKISKPIEPGPSRGFLAVGYPNKRAFIVSGSRGCPVRVLDETTGRQIYDLAIGDDDSMAVELRLISAHQLVGRLRNAADRSKYVSWDLAPRARVLSTHFIEDYGPCEFAPDGRVRIGVDYADRPSPPVTDRLEPPNEIVVQEAFQDRIVWHRPLAGNRQVSLAASPLGQTVLTATTRETWTGNFTRREDSHLQVWELTTCEEQFRVTRDARWEGFGKPLFSPNGRVIVAPWGERVLLFFDALTGRELGQFKHDIGLKPLAFTRDGKRMATGVADGTILIWDVGKFTFNTKTRQLSQLEIELSWRDLAGEIKPAVAAMARLEESPTQAIAVFRERLKPVPPIPANKFQPLIGDLQSPEFAKREQATRELARYGERAHPALRNALSAGPPAESRKRIETLLADPYLVKDPGIRRHLRAIELTAALDTPEAKALLAEWAKGDPDARETQAAKMALER